MPEAKKKNENTVKEFSMTQFFYVFIHFVCKPSVENATENVHDFNDNYVKN